MIECGSMIHKISVFTHFRTFANETNDFLAPYEASHKAARNLSFGPASIGSPLFYFWLFDKLSVTLCNISIIDTTILLYRISRDYRKV